MALVKAVCLHCAELAAKTIICQLKPASANGKTCDGNKSHWWKRPLSNGASPLLLQQGKPWIICGHQCLVVTWSFMDQSFPFWFNSPCDWFSVRYCWKISTLKRAWNGESFEYRCLRLRALSLETTRSQETIAGWLCCFWQKLQLLLYKAEIFASKCLL